MADGDAGGDDGNEPERPVNRNLDLELEKVRDTVVPPESSTREKSEKRPAETQEPPEMFCCSFFGSMIEKNCLVTSYQKSIFLSLRRSQPLTMCLLANACG